MIKIVIAGAGFAGLNAALLLDRKFRRDKNVNITLIDKHDYHGFSPELYEVATADEEMTTIAQLRQSIVLPLKRLLAGTNINFLKSEAGEIDRERKTIKAGLRQVSYDFLILALGSQTEYFGVEGAEKHSLPLKTLNDAFRIRNALEFAVAARGADIVKPYIHFVVAGGGYTGVELAGELAKLAEILAWKNGYPPEKIRILVVEASNSLVPGFDDRASRDIFIRLNRLGVEIKLLSPIFKVEPHFISLVSGERIPYDTLIWTTGVRARQCDLETPASNKRGQFETDEYLRVKGEHNIFALGDIACVHGPGGDPVPTTAQAAIAQAEYLAEILPELMKNKKPLAGFRLGSHPFIVSVGGKWAILKSNRFYVTGFLPYLLRLGANWRYFARLLGWFKAARYVLFEAETYSRND